MPLLFHPNPGTILVCDYSTGFVAPEMVKARPVIVVSPRLRKRDDLCAVVPFSTSEPDSIMPYHCRLEFDPLLPAPWDSPVVWVKADMIATVSFERLDLIRLPRVRNMPRQYLQPKVSKDDFKRIQLRIINGLGMDSLISS